MKSLESTKYSRVKTHTLKLVERLDKAISLGVAAAYPLLFSMEVPDPIPDWKNAVRFGWKVVRVTARETFKVLKKGMP
jgi:hypothetical protein